jgi:hypothetical protein
VLRLKAGIRTRNIAVRLLVHELKQAGLQVPALPGEVGLAADGSSSSSGGGRLLARLTDSFGHGGGALNDTGKQLQVAAAGRQRVGRQGLGRRMQQGVARGVAVLLLLVEVEGACG